MTSPFDGPRSARQAKEIVRVLFPIGLREVDSVLSADPEAPSPRQDESYASRIHRRGPTDGPRHRTRMGRMRISVL
jgi:hypothetical protein